MSPMPLVCERMSFDEYLAFENAHEFRHEFIEGKVIEMGDTIEHAAVCAPVLAALAPVVMPYHAFSGSLRVRTPSGMSAYPNASVALAPVECDAKDRNALANPVLIVEVLSEETEARDRGDKFRHYRSCPSFVEYVLVASKGVPRIERFIKTDGVWTICDYAGPGQLQRLSSVDVVLDVDAIYAGLVGADGQLRVI